MAEHLAIIYAAPMVRPNAHERLVSFLPLKDCPYKLEASNGILASIVDLPKELLEHVFSYVAGKHDLAQLCKVNKRFFATALPLLYRTLHIRITAALNPCLAQMFTLENTGIAFVKNVYITTDLAHASNPAPTHQWLDLIVNRLPQDCLSTFQWKIPHAVPARLFRNLWQRQRRLRCIEIFPKYIKDAWSPEQEDAQVDLMAELSKNNFASVRRLRVVPDTNESALLASSALRHGVITGIEVDGRMWQNGDAREEEEEEDDDDDDDDDDADHDKSTIKDPLTKYLFDHLERVKPGRVPRHDTLTSLTIKDVNLYLSKHTWFTYLNLCHLKHLGLEHCKGADIFLMHLSAGAASPALQTFILVHDLGNQADRTIYAIEELLSAPRHKLQTLELCLRNANSLPSVSTIRAHSRSVRVLLLDVASTMSNEVPTNDWNHQSNSLRSNFLAYSTTDFVSIIESCPSLVELGIAFPHVGLEYKCFDKNSGDFGSWTDLIASRSSLATLNILNWPDNYKYGRDEGYYIAKNLQLARLASDIFRRHRCFDREKKVFVKAERKPVLEVIAFGVREVGTSSPAPAYFVQSEVSILGRSHVHAHSVDLKYLRDQRLDIRNLNHEARDFAETSRRSLGASNAWETDSQAGDGGWDDGPVEW